MISSVTDITTNMTEIRTKTSSCVSEVDFDHTLREAISVEEMESGEISGDVTLSDVFYAASEKYNVPLNLLKAMAKQESDFNPKCVSSAGAQGIMQLMPSTARSLGVTDSFDVWQNVMGGAKYISQKLDMYDGDIRLALAAYNAGSGNVSKYGGVPPFKETRNYIKKVLSYMEQDVSVPNTIVSVSESIPKASSVKRQAQMGTLELKAEDGKTTEEISINPLQELLSSSATNLSKNLSESLRLYFQEQNKASISYIMEKLLMTQKDDDSEYNG